MRKYALLIGMFAAVILAGAGGLAAAAASGSLAPQATAVPSHTPMTPRPTSARKATGVVGVPAVRPRTATTDPTTPAITAEDVAAYVSAHPFPDRAGPNAPVTIENIEFLTSREVAARVGGDTGLPDGTLLCLVTLRGSFAATAPGVMGRTSQAAYDVFDAHTGNLVLEVVGR